MDQQKKFVLVIEDDKFFGDIYRREKLSSEGYDVVIATDGEQGIKAARERKPDLILLDLIMPVMNGFETLEVLKSDENLKDVKVIVLSNLGQDIDIKKAKELGADDFVVKTNVSIQEVSNKIRAAIK